MVDACALTSTAYLDFAGLSTNPYIVAGAKKYRVRDPGITLNLDYDALLESDKDLGVAFDFSKSDNELGDLGEHLKYKFNNNWVMKVDKVKTLRGRVFDNADPESVKSADIATVNFKNSVTKKVKRLIYVNFHTVESIASRNDKYRTTAGAGGFDYSSKLLAQLGQRSLSRFIAALNDMSELQGKRADPQVQAKILQDQINQLTTTTSSTSSSGLDGSLRRLRKGRARVN